MLEVWGAIFIIVIGTLAHFVYEWSHHNKFVGYFVAVNESTWEHMKLIMGPALLWYIAEIHMYAGNPSLPFVKFVSLCVMVTLMPLLFYGYRHFAKHSILAIDISIFLISVIAGQVLFHFLIQLNFSGYAFQHIGYLGLLVIFIKYISSTYTPDHNFIYKDPITHRYGIRGHSEEHGGKKS